MQQTFLSLRTRNFRLFFIGQTISNTGNWLTNVALTLLVLHLTHSGLAVGFLAAAQYGPILLLTLWAGAIADRSDKRQLLFVTQGLEMLESVALAFLAFMHHPPIVMLFIIAAIGGILLAFDNPLRRSFVSEMVPPEDVPNAVVLYSTIINVARVIGPALAGALIVSFGYGWCFTIDALTYLAVILCLWLMRPSELRREPPKPKTKGEVRAGLRYVAATPVTWISFVMLAAIGSLAYNFQITLPLLVTGPLHGTAGSFTIVYSVYGIGALVGGLLVASRRLVQLRHVVTGAAALGVNMLVLALVPNVTVIIPVIFILGITSILYMNATTTIAQIESAAGMRGRVLALQSVLFIGTTPIGGPLLGALADAVGARSPILVGAVVCLIAAVFGSVTSRRFLKT